MKRMRVQFSAAAIVLAAATILSGFGTVNVANAVNDAASDATGRKPSDVPAGEDARVTRVIDGDTIEVNLNSQTVTVNYIGVSAPTGNSCYAAQATAANANLVNGQRVRLEKDTTNADANGALLRYVYLLDGRMANEELLSSSSARTAVMRPDIKYQQGLAALEAQAYAAKRGLWGRCKVDAPQPVYSPTVCATIQVEDLVARSDSFPDKTLLHNGDCVNIVKPENPAGAAWGGKYIYHPKGSIVTLTDGYLRWKDAFVPMTVDESGNPFVFKSLLRRTIRKTGLPRRSHGESDMGD